MPIGNRPQQEDLMLLYIWFITVTDPTLVWRVLCAERSGTV